MHLSFFSRTLRVGRRALFGAFFSVGFCGVSVDILAQNVALPGRLLAAPGEIIVGVAPGWDGALAAQRFAPMGQVIQRLPQLSAYRIRLNPGFTVGNVLPALRLRGDVRYAEPNVILRADATPNDTHFVSKQWGPQKMQADLAWELWEPKSRVEQAMVVAVIDTGVDNKHPDLTNVMFRDEQGIVGYDAFNDQRGDAGAVHAHGTECSGIIAAQTNNARGIAGIAGWNGVATQTDASRIKIMPILVLNAKGEGTEAGVAAGILWAVEHGAKVLSLSLGDSQFSQLLEDALEYAWNQGCVNVASAGNEGNTAFHYPAYSPTGVTHTISVAATSNTADDAIPSWSTRGSWVSVSAPGEHIYTTQLNNGYANFSGTSAACPHVAGLAALIWAQNPMLTNMQVRELIVNTVDKYATSRIAPNSGRVNAFKAILATNATLATLKGSVTLEGCVNAAQSVTVEFRSSDGYPTFTRTTALTLTTSGAVGTFTLPNILPKTYQVAIKGAKWLRRVVNVDLSGVGVQQEIAVTLQGGDANNDNIVNLPDLARLRNAFGARPGDGNWNPNADLNCDNIVNLRDLALIRLNLGKKGDP